MEAKESIVFLNIPLEVCKGGSLNNLYNYFVKCVCVEPEISLNLEKIRDKAKQELHPPLQICQFLVVLHFYPCSFLLNFTAVVWH